MGTGVLATASSSARPTDAANIVELTITEAGLMIGRAPMGAGAGK